MNRPTDEINYLSAVTKLLILYSETEMHTRPCLSLSRGPGGNQRVPLYIVGSNVFVKCLGHALKWELFKYKREHVCVRECAFFFFAFNKAQMPLHFPRGDAS